MRKGVSVLSSSRGYVSPILVSIIPFGTRLRKFITLSHTYVSWIPATFVPTAQTQMITLKRGMVQVIRMTLEKIVARNSLMVTQTAK